MGDWDFWVRVYIMSSIGGVVISYIYWQMMRHEVEPEHQFEFLIWIIFTESLFMAAWSTLISPLSVPIFFATLAMPDFRKHLCKEILLGWFEYKQKQDAAMKHRLK